VFGIKQLTKAIERHTDIMATKLSELAGVLTGIDDTLDKAKTEIVNIIAELRKTDPDISPEGQAALDRLSTLAKALDDVVPDA